MHPCGRPGQLDLVQTASALDLNPSSLLPATTTHRGFGPLALYSLYFGGGLAAILDKKARVRELGSQMYNWVALADRWGALGDVVNSMTKSVSNLVAPRLAGSQYVVGASAGAMRCIRNACCLCVL